MKIYFFFIVCFVSISVYAQNQDFERTGFEIKAIAMQEEKSALNFHIGERELPSKFTLAPLFKEKSTNTIPLIFRAEQQFAAKNTTHRKDPTITISPLKINDIYAFGDSGSVNRVKNIAYKPAQGGNIYDAYCRAVYAQRAGN